MRGGCEVRLFSIAAPHRVDDAPVVGKSNLAQLPGLELGIDDVHPDRGKEPLQLSISSNMQ